jgi:nucleotide-binding universal stress UspA family protein
MNRILVALDTSDTAAAVLDYAVELARRLGSKLILFRVVIVPVDFPAQAFTIAPSQLTPLLMEQSREAMTKMAARVPAELLEGTDVDMGTPWRCVCRAAETSHADMIVIGSHTYGGLDRVLGTTAARIVNHANCPVLVVRHPESHPV